MVSNSVQVKMQEIPILSNLDVENEYMRSLKMTWVRNSIAILATLTLFGAW